MQKISKDTAELKSPIKQMNIIVIEDYFTQQQENAHFSQVHMEHKPR